MDKLHILTKDNSTNVKIKDLFNSIWYACFNTYSERIKYNKNHMQHISEIYQFANTYKYNDLFKDL